MLKIEIRGLVEGQGVEEDIRKMMNHQRESREKTQRSGETSRYVME